MTSRALPAGGTSSGLPAGDPAAGDLVRVERAKRAVAWVFGVNGFLFASWISRLPAVRDLLNLTPGELGLLLLSISVGSVGTLLVAGFLVHHLGPRRTVVAAAAVMTGGLAVAGATPALPVMVTALVLVGAGTGVWDVAMNVEGAAVERLLGRAIMPRFHAGFSLGTVGGALAGAGAAAAGLPVSWHVAIAAAAGLAVARTSARHFLSSAPVADGAAARAVTGAGAAPAAVTDGPGASVRSSGVLRAWREPRTLLIGVLALGMAFAEGSANDWFAVGLVDGYRVDHAVAALGFGTFVTAMTAARTAGPWTLARWGRVAALRAGALLVAAGVLAFVAGPWVRSVAGPAPALALAAVAALSWGCGAALGFPVAMSAAADEPAVAAARVSVVSAIGYVAFLAGPPFLGLLGDRVGVVRAMLGVGAAVLLSLAAAGAARPPADPALPPADPALPPADPALPPADPAL